MLSPELQVPVRVAAELFDRSFRLKGYLDRIGSGESNELVRLIAAIRRALESVERETIRSLAEPWEAFADDAETRDAIDALWRTLGKFSRWFATIHEMLVLLPGERTSPELAFTLQGCFTDLYTEYAPSIALGSIFNAFEFDFVEILKQRIVDIEEIFLPRERIVVLQLAICDTDSPLAYAVLGHELGHAIDSSNTISDRIAGKFVTDPDTELYRVVRDWCGELCADIVAARALGPAPLLSLLSMEYCFHPVLNLWSLRERDPTKPGRLRVVTHPMSWARLRVVLEELAEPLDRGLIDSEVESYRTACDVNLERWYPNKAEREAQRQLQDALSENFIPLLAKGVRDELSSLNLRIGSVDFGKESVTRCVDRLGSGSPVSAQGESRKSLHPKVRLFKQLVQQKSFESPEGRQQAWNALFPELPETEPKLDDPQEARQRAFQMLCQKCEETPLDIPKILLSGHLRRSECIHDLYGENQPLGNEKLVGSLCDSLAKLDRIIGSSIRTRCVHERVLERIRASGEERADV
jgi:hypothetical protein